jgi:hypothetical protein
LTKAPRGFNTQRQIDQLSVQISPILPLLRKPLATCSIFATRIGEDGIAHPSCRLTDPKDDTELGRLLFASATSMDAADYDAVVERVKVLAAQCLAHQEQCAYRLPGWYVVTGALIGWPLGALIWLLLSFAGGFWGFFLGWIPAWIAVKLSRWLWLPALAAIAWHSMNQ